MSPVEIERAAPAVIGAPGGCATLHDLLRLRADEDGARPAYAFLRDGEAETGRVTWSELERVSRSFAARLQSVGGRGARVLLAQPPGLEFVAAFLGCMMAGAVAVPCAPPGGRRSRPRFCSVARDAEPAIVVTNATLMPSLRETVADLPELAHAAWLPADLATDDAHAWRDPAVGSDSLALLQYTSGSTTSPRGILLTHAHLLHNLRMIRDAFTQSRESVVVGWLPLFHDMGLIGNVLSPLFTGASCVLMPPAAFLQRPVRWLRAISTYRGTTSGGPDFAYALCAARIDGKERADLDLSCWRTAFSGSEPVRPETLDRFAAVFEPHGFRREAFVPCYGLAEATLFVSGELRSNGPRLLEDPGGNGRARVSCGPPAGGLRILVADAERGTPLPPGQVGELWISGPSVGLGYWRREEETRSVFGLRPPGNGPETAPFLRTGDLGFLNGEELAITGRLKDLIILRGRNHYPRDIEATVESVSPSLKIGGGAAFGVEVGGEERLVVAHEVERAARGEDPDALIDLIRAAVAEAHEVQPYAVLLLRPGGLRRTTSGKVQRRACAAAFASGTLDSLGASVLGRPRLEAAPALGNEALVAASAEERRHLLETYLASLAGVAVGCALVESDRERSLGALGLDSLGAFSVQHAVDRDLGLVVEFSELLGGGSIRSLAGSMCDRWEALRDRNGVSLEVRERADGPRADLSGPAPRPSHGQRSLWLQNRLAPESGAYHLPFAVRLGASVDVDALVRALRLLPERHPALRSVFDTTEGEPRLRAVGALGLTLERTDASAWSPEELAHGIAAEARRPFDLERGPLLRARLFSEQDGRHVLVLVLHHVAVDFWSLAILLDELSTIYAAERRGAAHGLPRPAASYAEFAAWQQSLVSGPIGAELVARWRTRLAGVPAGLDLPIDRSRPPVPHFDGDRIQFDLGADRTRTLRDVAAREGVTPYTILLSAFGTLLARLGGQEDLVLGSPVAGRPARRFADAVGYFTNLVPIRLDLTGDPSFTDVMLRARARVLEAVELQHLPLPVLLERIQPVRELGRTPLFQVVMAYERAHRMEGSDLAPLALGSPAPPLRFGELELEPLACQSGGAPFELTLLMIDSPAGIRACLDFRTDLFDRRTVERLRERFLRVLDAAMREPATRLSCLPLLEDEERRMVVEGWNETAAGCPRERCVHELVEEQARIRPESEAVRDGRERVSYRQLVARSTALSCELRRRGVGVEDRVGVLLDRSVGMVVAVLGVLEAGAAYVPLDGSYPEKRLRWMVGDARVQLVVTSRDQVDRVRVWGVEVVELERVLAGKVEDQAERFDLRVDPEQLAYVIYTSGSTGTPKGVMVPHRAIVRLLWGDFVPFGPDEVFLGFAPLGFDASTLEVWGALAHGARLVLAPPGATSLDTLGAFIRESQATMVWLTAGLFHVMVEERQADLLGVRHLLAGGDVLSPAHVRKALEALPGIRLVNGYGPTEATTFTCCHVMNGPADAEDPVPIGRPIANSRVYVLDRWLGPVPPGVPGELWIGGDGLARGYLERPAQTAERFAPDPFGPPGGRLYRTGDRARWRADGGLEFLGRFDDQVKVRGFRVEPGEVEAALAEHPSIAAAAVVSRADGTAGAQLVAWVVPRDEAPGPEELRAELGARLPEHLIPARCVFVDRLPLMPNGKVDRRALARRPLPVSSSAAGPRTDLERLVAEAWSQALHVERVGLDENFFDLGAHSLMLAKVHAQLCDRLGRSIPIVDLFHHPTVRALAAHLAGEDRESPSLEDARRRGAARRKAAVASRRRRDAAAPEEQ